jgi:Single-strand binding protein family
MQRAKTRSASARPSASEPSTAALHHQPLRLFAQVRPKTETAAEHLSKGRLVYVGGRLHSRSWTGKDGVSRRGLEIIADEIQFLTPKPRTAPVAEAA